MTSTPTLDTVHATCRYGPHTIRRGALSTDGPWYADVLGGGDGIDCGGSPTGLHAPADGMSEVEQLRADQRMHMGVRLEVEKILDVALGPNEEDGAGGGLAADVALLADKLKLASAEVERLRAENVRLAGVVEERSAVLGLALHREEFSKGQHAVTRERLTEKERELAARKATAKVVVLCGSTRFRDEFHAAARDLALKGCIVLAPNVFSQSGDVLTDTDIARLTDVHRQKIRLADEVLVVSDASGYVGEATRGEIAYAERLGKPVTYLTDSKWTTLPGGERP